MSKITVSNPKKVEMGSLAGVYVCEVYLPDIAKSNQIYADDPDEAVKNANNFVNVYLEVKIRGIEILLAEKGDIRKKLAEYLDWAKRELIDYKNNNIN